MGSSYAALALYLGGNYIQVINKIKSYTNL